MTYYGFYEISDSLRIDSLQEDRAQGRERTWCRSEYESGALWPQPGFSCHFSPLRAGFCVISVLYICKNMTSCPTSLPDANTRSLFVYNTSNTLKCQTQEAEWKRMYYTAWRWLTGTCIYLTIKLEGSVMAVRSVCGKLCACVVGCMYDIIIIRKPLFFLRGGWADVRGGWRSPAVWKLPPGWTRSRVSISRRTWGTPCNLRSVHIKTHVRN